MAKKLKLNNFKYYSDHRLHCKDYAEVWEVVTYMQWHEWIETQISPESLRCIKATIVEVENIEYYKRPKRDK